MNQRGEHTWTNTCTNIEWPLQTVPEIARTQATVVILNRHSDIDAFGTSGNSLAFTCRNSFALGQDMHRSNVTTDTDAHICTDCLATCPSEVEISNHFITRYESASDPCAYINRDQHQKSKIRHRFGCPTS